MQTPARVTSRLANAGIAWRVQNGGCVMTKPVASLLTFLLGAVALPGAAQAESFGGQARAIGGDTLIVGAREVRLFGIEAPETSRRCDVSGLTWRCGEAAQQRLAALVAGRQVQCIATGPDASGRGTAVCAAGTTDLNRTMTELGLAAAQSGRGDVYLPLQARAKAQRLGIWASVPRGSGGVGARLSAAVKSLRLRSQAKPQQAVRGAR